MLQIFSHYFEKVSKKSPRAFTIFSKFLDRLFARVSATADGESGNSSTRDNGTVAAAARCVGSFRVIPVYFEIERLNFHKCPSL